MTTQTSLLRLILPVQGEFSGTWGDQVNAGLTNLLDTAIAGTTTLSTDADVTLTAVNYAADQARAAILLCSGARTAARNITAPASSKVYVVINSTTGGFGVVLRGAGPTTGVTIPTGGIAICVWNGSDFVATTANPTITGRIYGDFSTGTLANRVSFQTSTPNGVTSVQTLPNGTSTVSGLICFGGSDPANTQYGSIITTGGASGSFQITSGYTGTPASGTFVPISFWTSGAQQASLGTDGTFNVGQSRTTQFPSYGLFAAETTHATSRRAGIGIGNNWAFIQDVNGNGTRDFGIYDSSAGVRMTFSTAGFVTIMKGAAILEDIRTYRAATPTQGYIYYGSSGSVYAGYDGSSFVINAPLYIPGAGAIFNAPSGVALTLNTGGVTKGSVYADTTNFGILNSVGGWALQIQGGTNNVLIPNQINSLVSYTGSATLGISSYINYFNSAGAGTLTLPTGMAVGTQITVTNINTGLCTLARGGTSTIYAYGVNAATSIPIPNGHTVSLVFDGGNWVQAGGSASIGVNQTWQNMTGSRANYTTYTNDTGRPLFVYVNGAASGGGAGATNLTITNPGGGSVTLNSCYSSSSNQQWSVPGVVPPGGTYSIAAANGILSWLELR